MGECESGFYNKQQRFQKGGEIATLQERGSKTPNRCENKAEGDICFPNRCENKDWSRFLVPTRQGHEIKSASHRHVFWSPPRRCGFLLTQALCMSIDSATYTHIPKGPRCQSHQMKSIPSFQKTEIECFGGFRYVLAVFTTRVQGAKVIMSDRSHRSKKLKSIVLGECESGFSNNNQAEVELG